MDAEPQAEELPRAKRPRRLEAIEDFLRLFAPEGSLSATDVIAQHGDNAEAQLESLCSTPDFFRTQHLHFASQFFDPVQALYADSFVPPVPDSRPLDNVHKAQVLVPRKRADAQETARVGISHSSSLNDRDAAFWRGDVSDTLFSWLADAFPAGPKATCLQQAVKQHKRVRVVTRYASGAVHVISEWYGWLKGADNDGNVALIGATRHVMHHSPIETAEVSTAQQQDRAPPVGFRERVLQVVLLGHTVVSLSQDSTHVGSGGVDEASAALARANGGLKSGVHTQTEPMQAVRPSKLVEMHLRR